MINKENMRAWVAALRSGKFKQGQGKLTRITGDGFTKHCCLGRGVRAR